ncbi:ZIP family metal transporter [Marinimicrobium alkaliphilum]|uniref:ZIP family metal transporter n=1 Tax=Marinimicrobium alkaliphilum TaxID=2202654 RepID=UPI001E3C814C|nr:ZIP family metal transporter [Marinimicrobium alkaliphilum]
MSAWQAMLDNPDNVILIGSVASLLASFGTTLGAAGIFFVRALTVRAQDILLASAAGVMLAASIFSLLIPGFEIAENQGRTLLVAVIVVTLGMLIGAVILALIHHYSPHQHFLKGREGIDIKRMNGIWLFVIAITLHNFPEGMAVGVGFADGNVTNGIPLAIGIFIQNIPEGLAIAVALYTIGYSRTFAFWVAVLTGMIEPIGGLFGATLVTIAVPLLPWILGGAAGAMLFIISNEIIPETHKDGHENAATFALLGGFALMTILDSTL